MSDIHDRLDKHGGMLAIHVTPICGAAKTRSGKRKVIGWQNVAVCWDGTRFGLSLEDEAALKAGRESAA